MAQTDQAALQVKPGDEASHMEPTLSLGELPLLVESMTAVNVPKPSGKENETLPAYQVTFKGILDEAALTALVAGIREHRIVVAVKPPQDLEQ
jgi:hypothetical protein